MSVSWCLTANRKLEDSGNGRARFARRTQKHAINFHARRWKTFGHLPRAWHRQRTQVVGQTQFFFLGWLAFGLDREDLHEICHGILGDKCPRRGQIRLSDQIALYCFQSWLQGQKTLEILKTQGSADVVTPTEYTT